MKNTKIFVVLSGIVALLFGVAAKSDFQKKLQAHVSVQDVCSAVDSECSDKCTQNKQG